MMPYPIFVAYLRRAEHNARRRYLNALQDGTISHGALVELCKRMNIASENYSDPRTTYYRYCGFDATDAQHVSNVVRTMEGQ